MGGAYQRARQNARRRLNQLQCAIARRGLALNPKTQILSRNRNIKRAKQRIAKARKEYHEGRIGMAEVQQQVHSLLAYANHCDAHRTIEGILEKAVLYPAAKLRQ